MGRPGLENHRKFRRLARALGSRITARGVLELIWDSGYNSGDDRLGTAEDIESLVDWQGDRGALTQALLDAGQPDGFGFIEPIEEAPDDPPEDRERSERSERSYRIHDLFQHAPEYVNARRAHERERRIPKVCERCANAYHSGDPKSRYCTSRCRSAAWRENPNAANAPNAGRTQKTERTNAERTRPSVRERDPIPSHPIPVHVQAVQAVGADADGFPQPVENGNGRRNGKTATAARRPPDAPTIAQVTKLVHATIEDPAIALEGTTDLVEVVKRACAQAGFSYDGPTVQQGIERALSARGQDPNRPLDLARLRRNLPRRPGPDPEAGDAAARAHGPEKGGWEL